MFPRIPGRRVQTMKSWSKQDKIFADFLFFNTMLIFVALIFTQLAYGYQTLPIPATPLWAYQVLEEDSAISVEVTPLNASAVKFGTRWKAGSIGGYKWDVALCSPEDARTITFNDGTFTGSVAAEMLPERLLLQGWCAETGGMAFYPGKNLGANLVGREFIFTIPEHFRYFTIHLGSGTTTLIVTNNKNPVTADAATAFLTNIFLDTYNNRTHIYTIDDNSDGRTYSAPFNNTTSWTDGGIQLGAFDPAALNYEIAQCYPYDNSTNITIQCYFATGGTDNIFRDVAVLQSGTPYMTELVSLETVVDLSSQGGDSLDDLENYHGYVDQNGCSILLANIEDDSEATADEFSLMLTKEAATCGDHDFDVADTAAGYPKYDITGDAGYTTNFPATILPYDDGDGLIVWLNIETNKLNARYFNNTNNSVGTVMASSESVSWIATDKAEIAGTTYNSTAVIFGILEGSADVYAWIIENKTGSFSSGINTGLDAHNISGTQQDSILSATVNKNAPGNNNIWLCAFDDADTDDFLCAESQDGGTTWETAINAENDVGGTPMALTILHNDETCQLYYHWVNFTGTLYGQIFGNYSTGCGDSETPAVNNPPNVTILTPANNSNLTGVQEISWNTTDAEADRFLTNITANNGSIVSIASNLNDSVFSYDYNFSLLGLGNHTLTIESCENETIDLYCDSSTINISITDNELPIVTILTPANGSILGGDVAYETITHSSSCADCVGAIGGKGFEFTTKQAGLILNNITKFGGNATTARLYLASGDVLLANATFSGDNAIFNYTLGAAQEYYVVIDAAGLLYLHGRCTSCPQPVSGTYYDISQYGQCTGSTWGETCSFDPSLGDTVNGVKSISIQNIGTAINITWNTTDAEGDRFLTNITADNGSIVVIASNLADTIFNYYYDFATLGDGTHTLTITSCQNQTVIGNCGFETFTITVEVPTAPVLSILSPMNESNITGTQLISWLITDDETTLTSVEIDFVSIASNLPDSNSSFYFDFDTLTPGGHLLDIEACENNTPELLCGSDTHIFYTYIAPVPISCLYNPNIWTEEQATFICTLENVTDTYYNCFGITMNPQDESVLEIMPRYETVTHIGGTGGYQSSPKGAYEQSVKVTFSDSRIKADTQTLFTVKCVSNETSPATREYKINLTPSFSSFYQPGEIAVSLPRNMGYVVTGILLLILLLIIYLLIKRFVE